MADMPLDESMEVIIRDSTTSDNELAVNSDGSINTEFRTTNRIRIGGTYPSNTQDIPASSKSLTLSGTVPSGKTWLVTNWSVGGKGKGTGELTIVDSSNISTTTLDSLDSITGWAKGGAVNSFTLDTTDKYEGTGSIKVSVDFSGAGLQTGKLTKTYSPTLDLTAFDTISLYAKAEESNCSIYLKVFQGGSNYTFAPQFVAKGVYGKIQFDLSEITLFSPTAIDKIEINFNETTDFKKDYFVWIDYIHGISGEIRQSINSAYFSAFTSFGIQYPRYLLLPANTTLNVYITNNDSATLTFTTAYNGIEV